MFNLTFYYFVRTEIILGLDLSTKTELGSFFDSRIVYLASPKYRFQTRTVVLNSEP